MRAGVTSKKADAARSLRKSPTKIRRGARPRRTTASSRIYSELRNELVSLRRRPGEAISEAEIALSYGLSRTPVREAILKLADEGLVDIFPQSGIFVSRVRGLSSAASSHIPYTSAASPFPRALLSLRGQLSRAIASNSAYRWSERIESSIGSTIMPPRIGSFC